MRRKCCSSISVILLILELFAPCIFRKCVRLLLVAMLKEISCTFSIIINLINIILEKLLLVTKKYKIPLGKGLGEGYVFYTPGVQQWFVVLVNLPKRKNYSYCGYGLCTNQNI